MKNYIYKRKKGLQYDTKILILTVIFTISIAVTDLITNKSIIKDFFANSLSPLKQIITNTINNVYSITVYGNEKNKLYYENQSITANNIDLSNKLVNYYKIYAENEQLKKYFGITEQVDDAVLTNATIILRNDRYNLTINKGSRNGVEIGDTVLTENGLVGFISKVSYTTSTVQTIMSPLTKVAVKNIVTDKTGVLNGDFELSKDNKVKLIYTKSKDDINIGDIITTSGIGDIYPENIKIGIITNICYDEYDTSIYAVVDIYEDIQKVEKVAVLKNFSKEWLLYL